MPIRRNEWRKLFAHKSIGAAVCMSEDGRSKKRLEFRWDVFKKRYDKLPPMTKNEQESFRLKVRSFSRRRDSLYRVRSFSLHDDADKRIR